ncbi:MAG: TonB-dependent receptor plug domain-containing protein [Caulobacteraceae bacterium]|nr:TonB-dependent receptor plug domain-containing protein [Caulobacteraceae bacterium]
MRRVRVVGSVVASVAGLTAGVASAQQVDDPAGDVTRLSLEELAAVETTSVSRRPEQLNQAAASVFVITADDIRRSGAISLPGVLRLAPNLDVQQVNAVDYAISARGFNGFETPNKLLVLIDGRSVHSTLSSGVFWDARDLPLKNIERIEVISGPGGALACGLSPCLTWLSSLERAIERRTLQRGAPAPEPPSAARVRVPDEAEPQSGVEPWSRGPHGRVT